MDLVTDMVTDAKRAMRQNNFGMPFPFLSLSWILLIRLNPEMQRFAYAGIRRDNCGGTLCSSLLGVDSVSASRLTSVVF